MVKRLVMLAENHILAGKWYQHTGNFPSTSYNPSLTDKKLKRLTESKKENISRKRFWNFQIQT